MVVQHGKHNPPVDGIKSLLEINGGDSDRELVVLETFDYPPENVDLLGANARVKFCPITP